MPRGKAGTAFGELFAALGGSRPPGAPITHGQYEEWRGSGQRTWRRRRPDRGTKQENGSDSSNCCARNGYSGARHYFSACSPSNDATGMEPALSRTVCIGTVTKIGRNASQRPSDSHAPHIHEEVGHRGIRQNLSHAPENFGWPSVAQVGGDRPVQRIDS